MGLIKKLLAEGRRKSPWVARFDCGGCNGCAVECLAALTPLFDARRFGVAEVDDPARADILLVTGAPDRQCAGELRQVWEGMLSPKAVVAVGDCALAKGPFHPGKEGADPLNGIVEAHVRVAGCPPGPEAVLRGVLEALRTLDPGSRPGS